VKVVWERDPVTTAPCYFTDTTLDKLPLRKSDGARVIDTARNVSRIYCKPSGITYLKRYVIMDVKTIKKINIIFCCLSRPGGIEQQFRHRCTK